EATSWQRSVVAQPVLATTATAKQQSEANRFEKLEVRMTRGSATLVPPACAGGSPAWRHRRSVRACAWALACGARSALRGLESPQEGETRDAEGRGGACLVAAGGRERLGHRLVRELDRGGGARRRRGSRERPEVLGQQPLAGGDDDGA